MHLVRKLIREVHRRSLWQVISIYLAGSWGVLQVVEYMTEFAGLPEWTPSMAFILLLIGLPVTTATATRASMRSATVASAGHLVTFIRFAQLKGALHSFPTSMKEAEEPRHFRCLAHQMLLLL